MVDDAVPTWEELVRGYHDQVFGHAYRLTRNVADAEDLTHDTFVRAFRSLDRYTPGTVGGWLHRITRNLFLDGARRRQLIRFENLGDDAERTMPGDELGPERSFEHTHLASDVLAALQALPPDFRDVVVLSDLEDLPYPEIADVLGVNPGTVRSRIHRGRLQLRDSLAHRRDVARAVG